MSNTTIVEKLCKKAKRSNGLSGEVVIPMNYTLGSVGELIINGVSKKFCVEWNKAVKMYTLGIENKGKLDLVATIGRPAIRIIVHSGKVHRDEFYAVSLLAVMEDADIRVERRNPSEEELEDTNCFVLDVGKEYAPEKKNFDHHQWKGGDNAFTLLLKHYNIKNEKLLALGEASRVLDTEGYPTFSKKYPAGFTFSALESTILESLQRGQISWVEGTKFMRMYFKQELVIKPKQLAHRSEILDNNTSFENGILVIKEPLTLADGLEPAFGIEEWSRSRGIVEDIQVGWGIDRATQKNIVTVYITREGQNKGYSTVDMKCEEFTFVHKAGFLASTKTQNLEKIVSLVHKYITGV